MNDTPLWRRAEQAAIQIDPSVKGGFDIGFDRQIPADTLAELRRFIAWAESKFSLPVPLWVDFEHKHYLVSRDGKRVGYLFYWADWENYPVFTDPDKGPSIRLPVRTKKSSMAEILTSFIEGICDYFAWLLNELDEEFIPCEEEIEEILAAYLRDRQPE